MKREEIQALIKGATSLDVQIRRQSVVEISNRHWNGKYLLLQKLLQREKNPLIRQEITRVLDQADLFSKEDKKKQKMIWILSNQEREDAVKSAMYMQANPHEDFIEPLKKASERFKESGFSRIALRILESLDSSTPESFSSFLFSSFTDVVALAATILAKKEKLEFLCTLLCDSLNLSASSRILIVKILKKTGIKRVTEGIEFLANSALENHRYAAAFWISLMPEDEFLPSLEILCADEVPKVSELSWNVMEELEKSGNIQATEILSRVGKGMKMQFLLSEAKRNFYKKVEGMDFFQIKEVAIKTLDEKKLASLIQAVSFCRGNIEEKLEFLLSYLQHKNNRVRANAVEAIGFLKGYDYCDKIAELLEDPCNRVRGNAILMLADCPEYASVWFGRIFQAIKDLCAGQEANHQLTAAFCLEYLREEKLIPLAIQFLNSSSGAVRDRISQVLEDWSKDSMRMREELERNRMLNPSFSIRDEDYDEFI